MNIKTKTMLLGMLLALLSLAFSIGVATSYAAEVGFIQNGDSAEDFKLYEVGDNLFQTELPHEFFNFSKQLNYQNGYRLDNGGEYYPLTDYVYHLATWRHTQSYSNGNLGELKYYVYIPQFNPDFPGHTDPNQPEGKIWHNTLYLYEGSLPAGRYMLRNNYQRPAGTTPSGVLIPDDNKAFRLMVSVFDRDPDTGEVLWSSQTTYSYPTNAVFDVDEGDYVVVYYTFYEWEFDWYQSLGTSLHFSYMPQIYRLTEITPSDLANSGQTFEELMAQFKWESYQDGHGDGYKLGYEEGFLNGLDEGYLIGFADGEEVGYTDGYSAGSKDGYFKGHQQGQIVGEERGYGKGYEAGELVGFAAGQEEAYPRGYDAGYDIGEYEGYIWGKDVGNEEGYKRGVKELDTAGGIVGSFFSSTWDIVVDAVTIVSEGTTINGISISGIIFTAIGVFILGFIIKKIVR